MFDINMLCPSHLCIHFRCILLNISIFIALHFTMKNINYEYEPRREKTVFFAYAKTKTQISFAVTAKLISAFVFATLIVQSLYFLNPKFHASSYLLWLYSPVCVGNPEDWFSQNEAHMI